MKMMEDWKTWGGGDLSQADVQPLSFAVGSPDNPLLLKRVEQAVNVLTFDFD